MYFKYRYKILSFESISNTDTKYTMKNVFKILKYFLISVIVTSQENWVWEIKVLKNDRINTCR